MKKLAPVLKNLHFRIIDPWWKKIVVMISFSFYGFLILDNQQKTWMVNGTWIICQSLVSIQFSIADLFPCSCFSSNLCYYVCLFVCLFIQQMWFSNALYHLFIVTSTWNPLLWTILLSAAKQHWLRIISRIGVGF